MPAAQQAPLRLAALLKDAPLVMGIVNATPDSFHDRGRHASAAAAIEHGLRLAREGADLLDVGGESTRPGAAAVSEAEELERILPVIEALARRVAIPIAVDTSKARVAEAAFAAGARMLNDVSALSLDPAMPEAAARLGGPVVLMHMRGTPRTMQKDPRYADVVVEVRDYLKGRIAAFEAAGGARDQVLVDPGLGFGKNLEHNLALLKALPRFAELSPVLVGASRKSFLGRLMAGEQPGGPALDAERLPSSSERLAASLAAALAAACAGAAVLRVHDAGETRHALSVWRALA